jgi:hypothetical protein
LTPPGDDLTWSRGTGDRAVNAIRWLLYKLEKKPYQPVYVASDR